MVEGQKDYPFILSDESIVLAPFVYHENCFHSLRHPLHGCASHSGARVLSIDRMS